MNENIDLTKILKDCPKGWKFYSSIYGEVEFKTIKFEQLKPTYNPNMWIDLSLQIEEDPHPIKFIAQNVERSVSKTGEHQKGIGECTLFPSKEQRDWSKFTAPWYKKDRFDPKTLKTFDMVLVRDNDRYKWRADFYSHKSDRMEYPYRCVGKAYTYCIPYNEDTKHLVGTTDEAPEYYRY